MWAEANNYIYKGRTIAKTKGGALYSCPEIVVLDDSDEEELQLVDVKRMVEKNGELLEGFAQETIQKIYNTYREYKEKIDVFYVAFSGGKDSIVALDLVQRALPHNEFIVLFGDTGMEFSDAALTVKSLLEAIISSKMQDKQSFSSVIYDEFGTSSNLEWRSFA